MAEPIFDAPIPGSSLTKEVGSSPMKNPPQYATLEEAVNFYVDRMSTEEFTNKLVTNLEMGIPVTSIVNVIQMHGVMEGRHTLDVSILLMPILMEMIALIGDSMGIEYDMGLEDEAKIEEVENDILNIAKMKLNKKQFNRMAQEEMELEQPAMEEEVMMEEQQEMSTGLMARGI